MKACFLQRLVNTSSSSRTKIMIVINKSRIMVAIKHNCNRETFSKPLEVVTVESNKAEDVMEIPTF